MVAMERLPYITPVTELLSVRIDNALCVLTTSPDPFEDYGDYSWDDPEEE